MGLWPDPARLFFLQCTDLQAVQNLAACTPVGEHITPFCGKLEPVFSNSGRPVFKFHRRLPKCGPSNSVLSTWTGSNPSRFHTEISPSCTWRGELPGIEPGSMADVVGSHDSYTRVDTYLLLLIYPTFPSRSSVWCTASLPPHFLLTTTL